MPRFRIVPEDSQVWVEMHTSLHPIQSSTAGLEGWIDVELDTDGRLDLNVEPRAQLELPVEVLSSGNPLYDREMLRRIDAQRYPTIRGQLTEIEAVDSTGRYLVRGQLTFHGVTNEYEREMGIAADGDGGLTLEGENVFDIRAFNVRTPKVLMLQVHPDVAVRVRIVARHEG